MEKGIYSFIFKSWNFLYSEKLGKMNPNVRFTDRETASLLVLLKIANSPSSLKPIISNGSDRQDLYFKSQLYGLESLFDVPLYENFLIPLIETEWNNVKSSQLWLFKIHLLTKIYTSTLKHIYDLEIPLKIALRGEEGINKMFGWIISLIEAQKL